MRRKYPLIFFLYLISFLVVNSFSQDKSSAELSPKYQQWLELVHYIITPEEREVFMNLQADWERDIFIEAFWKQRDPTKGTPQNEYKQEHMRRFNYANTYYGRSTTRPGWMTDMGKYYIILGPPSSIDHFDNVKDILPTQVWYYYGDKELGLPTYFALVFTQRRAGEYELYNPVSDGPASLMRHPEGQVDFTDYRSQYEKIKRLAPDLARVALSSIPGEIPYNYSPSLRSNMLLAKIEELPAKEVKTTYATNFLEYKGYVSTEYLTNFVECIADVSVISEPSLKMNFVHFSIVPQEISIDYYEPNDQYYCNYTLSVSLKKSEDIIYQYSKDYPFYFKQEQVPEIRASGIAIQDTFPVPEGKFNLNILIQNSVAKEFSVFETEIAVPGNEGEVNEVRIAEAFLGYKLEDDHNNNYFPYKMGGKAIAVDPKNTFSKNDKLVLYMNIIGMSEMFREKGEVEIILSDTRESKEEKNKIYSAPLNQFSGSNASHFFRELPLEELKSDYYQMQLNLIGEELKIIDSKKINFIISPQAEIAHPISLKKVFSLSNLFVYYYILAFQYDKLNKVDLADFYFNEALQGKPDYLEGLIGYADFCIRHKNYEKVLPLLEKVKDKPDYRFQYFLLKGRALMGLNRYNEALVYLQEGNKIYDSDVVLLNSLGICYQKTGQIKKALEVFEASLRLNTEQEEIRKIIHELEAEK